MTELEHRAVMVLPKISYGRNTWHEPRAQTLYRYLHADPLWPLTKHEENDLWFLIWRYRRQVNDAELIARASEVVTGERVLVWWPMKNEKVILVIRCADCGAELNRSPRPLSKREASIARVSSGFAGSKCPNGCRSTFSDLNLNTRLEEIPA